MPHSNKSLKKAAKNKNDEFYTQYKDVEDELKYYTKHLENKIIYCNCDDYNKSNFFKYFYNNFKELKLKKLITTCYYKDKNGLYSIYDGNNLISGELKRKWFF